MVSGPLETLMRWSCPFATSLTGFRCPLLKDLALIGLVGLLGGSVSFRPTLASAASNLVFGQADKLPGNLNLSEWPGSFGDYQETTWCPWPSLVLPLRSARRPLPSSTSNVVVALVDGADLEASRLASISLDGSLLVFAQHIGHGDPLAAKESCGKGHHDADDGNGCYHGGDDLILLILRLFDLVGAGRARKPSYGRYSGRSRPKRTQHHGASPSGKS